jgi:transcriptional regulator
MDAFDRILNRIPNATKRNMEKNLAIANRIIEILRGQGKTQRDLARALGKSESEISTILNFVQFRKLKRL